VRPLDEHLEDAFKDGFLAGVKHARENIPRESVGWWEALVKDYG